VKLLLNLIWLIVGRPRQRGSISRLQSPDALTSTSRYVPRGDVGLALLPGVVDQHAGRVSGRDPYPALVVRVWLDCLR
jgi:hypothetical protein